MRKKYLVTGGSGFIGSALVRRLVKDGHKVRVLDNGIRGDEGRLKDVMKDIEVFRKDVRDRGALRRACRGVDSVCHLAYLNGTSFFYTKPHLVLEIGVKGAINIIDSSIAEGVKEFIFMSSSEVYQTPPKLPTDENVPLSVPDPLNPRYSYGAGKIIGELLTINYGRRYFDKALVVRPHNVYGPDMGHQHVVPQFIARMARICKRDKMGRSIRFPIQGSGNETRAFVFIKDFIEGLVLVMKKGRHMGVYNIGTEDEIKIKDVAKECAAYFGKKAAIIPGRPPEGETPRRCPDITKIRRLGYRPRVSFTEGFRITADWYISNPLKRRKI